MTKRDHYICAALAGVVARMKYPTNDLGRAEVAREAIAYAEAAMREADRAANKEADWPFRR